MARPQPKLREIQTPSRPPASVNDDVEAQGASARADASSDDTAAARAATIEALRTAPGRVEENSPAEALAPARPLANPDADASAAAPAAKKRRGWLRPTLFALLPVALVAGGYEYVTGGAVMSTENAYVRADMVGISTDVSGIVKSVAVHDNQTVAKGDVLFRLDDEPFRLALDRANAQIGIVKNDLDALKASYRDMGAQIDQQQVEVQFYEGEFKRQQQLVSRGVATQANFDQAQRNLQSAKEKQSSLKQQLAGITANLSGNPDLKAEDAPRYIEAVAQRDEAARQLRHTVVHAPMAGIVTNVPSLQPGQYLAAATPAFSIVSSDHVWVEANPKETELTYVRPGQTVDVSVDSYPGVDWKGTVESISPASGSSFSLLPAQNTTGNWVKVVQRIPLRIRIATPDDKPPLRAGMSVEVGVETGHSRGLPEFLTRWFGGASADAATSTKPSASAKPAASAAHG